MIWKTRKTRELELALHRVRSLEDQLEEVRQEKRDAEKAKATLYCSFCGKSQHDVQKLIAGPGKIFICNECVALCVDILCGAQKEEKK